MDWQNLGASVIGAVLGSGLVSGYFSLKFSQRLERLKTTLSGELFERQTKFAWLHTERSKTLAKLYALLWSVGQAFGDMLHPIQSGGSDANKARIEKTAAAADEFFEFCGANGVFFDSDLRLKLANLEEQYRRVWSTFVPNAELLPTGAEWLEAWKSLGQDVAPIQTQIEQKVREMLGVDLKIS